MHIYSKLKKSRGLFLLKGLFIYVNCVKFIEASIYMIVSGEDILDILRKNNVKFRKHYIITKESYDTIDTNLLQKDILPKYWRWLSIMKLNKWNNKWNCINFSESFRVFISGYFSSRIQSSAQGIAVGIIHYQSESRPENKSSGNHAINIIAIEENNECKVIFLEPQTCRIIELTKEEYNSIHAVYI
jgi:hypothetical protein